MRPEEIEHVLTELKDPTTAPVLAKALGYKDSTSITRACREKRIPGAERRGGIWLIPVDGVWEAIMQGTLQPGHKSGTSPKEASQLQSN